MSAEFLAVVVMFVASNGLYAVWARQARQDRRSIVNACLSRTPAEFELLESLDTRGRKGRKDAHTIPPIGL